MSSAPGVLIVEDHTIVRQGLVALLEAKDYRVLGECGTGLEGVRMAADLAPDIVLLDLSLPDMNGVEVIHSLKEAAPAARVVVLSMHDGPEYVRPALRAGITGYLVKGADIGALTEALASALEGRVYLSPGIARVVMEDGDDEGVGSLTPRELEILRLVAQGKTSREIALILEIAPRTVENHRQRIMNKIGVHDVAGLTRLAIRAGVVTPD